VTAFLSEVLMAVPYGALLGVLFGPLRLAGVDYSKWYRNPGEVSEGTDPSWIGLMKQVSLNSARVVLAVALLARLCLAIVSICDHGVMDYTIRDMLGIAGSVLTAVCGLALGAAIPQAVLEGLWRRGLRQGTGRRTGLRGSLWSQRSRKRWRCAAQRRRS
jgi:hypothetical protein